MRILFTDRDLDGAGVAILLKRAYPDLIIETSGPYHIDEKLREWMGHLQDPNDVVCYIADMTIQMQTASRLDEWVNKGLQVIYLDHHESSFPLRKFPWTTIATKMTIGDRHVDACSTALMWRQLSKRDDVVGFMEDILQRKSKESIGEFEVFAFVDMVRAYDTFDMQFNPAFQGGIDLQFLYNQLGFEAFVSRFVSEINYVFTHEEQQLILAEANIVDEHIREACHCAKRAKFDGKSVVLIGANHGSSLVIHHVMQKFHAEIAILYNHKRQRVSIRTAKNSKVHAGKWAETFGGGGHQHAAGMHASKAFKKWYYQIMGPARLSFKTKNSVA